MERPTYLTKVMVVGESMEILPLFWKSLFISNFLCSIDRYAVENRFGRIYFVNYARNTGESGRCLGTPMKEADLIDSSGV